MVNYVSKDHPAQQSEGLDWEGTGKIGIWGSGRNRCPMSRVRRAYECWEDGIQRENSPWDGDTTTWLAQNSWLLPTGHFDALLCDGPMSIQVVWNIYCIFTSTLGVVRVETIEMYHVLGVALHGICHEFVDIWISNLFDSNCSNQDDYMLLEWLRQRWDEYRSVHCVHSSSTVLHCLIVSNATKKHAKSHQIKSLWCCAGDFSFVGSFWVADYLWRFWSLESSPNTLWNSLLGPNIIPQICTYFAGDLQSSFGEEYRLFSNQKDQLPPGRLYKVLIMAVLADGNWVWRGQRAGNNYVAASNSVAGSPLIEFYPSTILLLSVEYTFLLDSLIHYFHW